MARTLTDSQISALSRPVSRITKKEVYILSSLGFLNMDDDGVFTHSTKGGRALKRESRRIRAAAVREPVETKVMEMLVAEDALIQHRAVWIAVGRTEFERDEVLSAMKEMRDEGILETVCTTGNNFQIGWKLAATTTALAVA